eukprot:11183164-Lingulodinium_polyedra.AAC.1
MKVLVECASQKVFRVVVRQFHGRVVAVHARLNAPVRVTIFMSRRTISDCFIVSRACLKNARSGVRPIKR